MRLSLCLAFAVTSCAHASAPPKSSDVDAALPAGCDRSVAGNWVHENNASYQYTATDDGHLAHFIPRRVNGDGTLVIDPPDKTMAMDMTLQRRADGFSGDFRMLETLESGEQCGVLFLARVTSCTPDRLVLQVEQSYAVNQSCQRVDFGQSDMVEHILIRVKP